MFDVYIRVSRMGERSEEEATEVYEARCREWAGRNGVHIDEVEEDTDVSGATAVSKRRLERLIQRIEVGESEGIITPYLDRFGRDIIEGAVALKRITEGGGRLICVEDGFDSRSPGSELVFNIRMAIAQDFLNRVRSNYRSAVERKVSRGAYVYKAPFGYRKDEEGRLVVVEREAALVREVFERRAAGADAGTLQRFLREAGAVSAHSGKPLTKSGVRTLLANRAYLGEMSVQNGEKGKPRVIQSYHAPLVTPRLFEAANAVRGAFHPRDRKLSDQANLRGLVYCATCARRLRIGGYTAGGERVASYTCTSPGCEARASIRVSKLDGYVDFLLMQAAADREPHVEAVILGNTAYQDALAAVEEKRRAHDEFRDSIELQRELGIQGFAHGLRVRKQALEAARRELAKVRPAGGGGKGDDKLVTFAEFMREHQRDVNAQFLSRVVVRPNPGGRSGKKLPAAERVEVYFLGATEPYRPTYAELSEADLAKLPA